jgi:GT2 family glycosyltransferase
VLDLSIIIVNHNSTDFLLPCISSINRTIDSLSYETIVVDNASDIASLDSAEKAAPGVTFIRSSVNLGFSAANNVGIRASKGHYLLFLNPDTIVQDCTLSTMVRFMESHPDVGASTCFVQLPNGELDDAAHRGFPTPWNALCQFSGLSKLFPRSRLFSGYSLGWENLSVTHDIDALAGCFMLVRREAGEAAGWWDEDYFFYGEDLDFCYTLKQLGWRIAFVPEVSILHHKGMSSGIKKSSPRLSRADRSTRAAATHARFNAMKIFYDKHYRSAYPAPVRWLVLAGIALKQQAAVLQLRRHS